MDSFGWIASGRFASFIAAGSRSLPGLSALFDGFSPKAFRGDRRRLPMLPSANQTAVSEAFQVCNPFMTSGGGGSDQSSIRARTSRKVWINFKYLCDDINKYMFQIEKDLFQIFH